MFKKLARRALRFGPVGQIFCSATFSLGLERLSRGAARHCKYTPRKVRLDIGSFGGERAVGEMFSAEGNDQIVRGIWLQGLGCYEEPLPRLYAHLVRGSRTVLDIGANSGLYAIVAALAEPKCHVFAFEPFPPALVWLKRNIELNGLGDRVTIHPVAAGSETGTAEFYIPVKAFGETLETSSSLNRGFRKEHSEVLKVNVVTLDQHVRESASPPVSVLRIDVEGAEHLVLAGATDILRKDRPWVFVEVLSDSAADLLEPFRAGGDFGVLSMQTHRLTELPRVLNTPGIYNQLWYPRERRSEIVSLAAELNLPVMPN